MLSREQRERGCEGDEVGRERCSESECRSREERMPVESGKYCKERGESLSGRR